MILISDYDRTLKIDDMISDYDRLMIREFENKGHIFCVNSGRSYHHLQQNFNLQNFKAQITITGSGSQCHDSKGQTLFQQCMLKTHVLNLLNFIMVSGAITYQIASNDIWVHARREDPRWSTLKNEVNLEAVNSMSAKFNTLEDAQGFCRRVNGLHEVSAYQNGLNVDIAPYGVSKATGIYTMAQLLDIPKKDIYTIGDSLNDLEMIKEFSGFCVKVSHPEIKKVSSKEFDSVGDCIAYLLETSKL